MKQIKWRSLIISCLICLLPILFGLSLWEKLPDEIAIHFNINNEPDNFASKGFAVFGLPFLMVFAQIFCCIVTDLNCRKHGENTQFEKVSKWIIPVITILLQIITFAFALGKNIDIRRCALLIVGILFLILGNAISKLDNVKNYNIEPDKAKKINKVMGCSMVILGILAIITTLFPPIASIIWLISLIPYGIFITVYTIKSSQK